MENRYTQLRWRGWKNGNWGSWERKWMKEGYWNDVYKKPLLIDQKLQNIYFK